MKLDQIIPGQSAECDDWSFLIASMLHCISVWLLNSAAQYCRLFWLIADSWFIVSDHHVHIPNIDGQRNPYQLASRQALAMFLLGYILIQFSLANHVMMPLPGLIPSWFLRDNNKPYPECYGNWSQWTTATWPWKLTNHAVLKSSQIIRSHIPYYITLQLYVIIPHST